MSPRRRGGSRAAESGRAGTARESRPLQQRLARAGPRWYPSTAAPRSCRGRLVRSVGFLAQSCTLVLTFERIETHLMTPHDEISLEVFAKALCKSNRPEIRRGDEADGPRPVERVKRDPQRRSCGFKRVTATPVGASERPSDFALRPLFGIVKTYATHEGATRDLLNRPHAVAPQCPVSHKHRELTPCVSARQRTTIADIAHDFGVRAECGIVVKVHLRERPEPQARCVKRGRRVHRQAAGRTQIKNPAPSAPRRGRIHSRPDPQTLRTRPCSNRCRYAASEPCHRPLLSAGASA